MYRGEQLTDEGLSPVSHRLKMLCSSILVTYEHNKCITRMIVNECENILGTRAWFNWHRTNKICVNQCNVILGLGKDEYRPYKVKGSACSEDTGGY